MPEVVEYPDLGQITAQALTALQTGDRLWLVHDVEPGENEPASSHVCYRLDGMTLFFG
jgi:hypothetical protein